MSSNPLHTPLDAAQFRKACARWATGVTVATTLDRHGRPHGLTVSSFTSVSLEPPLVLIAIDHAASVLPHFRASAHYAVSVLRDTQQHFSSQFARRPDAERFDGVPWHPGTTGAPILDAALAVFECRVHNVVEAGDHALFIGEVLHTRAGNGAPLLYFHGAYRFLEPQP